MNKLQGLNMYETVLVVVKNTRCLSVHELQVIEFGIELGFLPKDTLDVLGALDVKIVGDKVRQTKEELNYMYGLGLE